MDGTLMSAEVYSPAKTFLAVGESSEDSLLSNTGFSIPVVLLSAEALKRFFLPDHLLLRILSYSALRLTEIKI